MDEKIKISAESSDKPQDLNEELESYRQLVETTPLCIKVFDAAGKLIFINKGGRKEHSIKDTDDISKWDWVASVKKEYQPAALEAFKKGINGETAHVTFEHTPEGSDHQWCEGLISPIKDANGKVKSVLFYSLDASAKKAAEAELAQKAKDLQTRNEELENMNKLMVDRELKMVELKGKIKELEEKLNTPNS